MKTNLYGDGRFVAVGNVGVILSSRNGIHWQKGISGTAVTLAAAAFGNGVFVAGGEDGLLLTSNDGVRWTPRNSGTRLYLALVDFHHESFHAESNGIRLTSDDGIRWSSSNSRETIVVIDSSKLVALQRPIDHLRRSGPKAIPMRAELGEFESAE